jgi:hypothetical protein
MQTKKHHLPALRQDDGFLVFEREECQNTRIILHEGSEKSATTWAVRAGENFDTFGIGSELEAFLQRNLGDFVVNGDAE